MRKTRRVGIALGSNLGDRLANLRAAVAGLREVAAVGDGAFLEASVYETEPQWCPVGSPDFYNSVAEFSYAGTVAELLVFTQALERRLGRAAAHERNAPRVVDVDLLYCGEERHETEELTLPHPRIGERRFVLQPLADIRPGLILPGQRRTVAELLADLASDEPPLVWVADLACS